MGATYRGIKHRELSVDEEGHRTITAVYQVEALSGDGPAIVHACSGLPQVGDAWADTNDGDAACLCLPPRKITPFLSEENNTWWKVECTFSTKPIKRCQDVSIENPLLEPAKVSGSFVKYTKAVDKDRDGQIIKSSSHEPLRGPKLEFDHNRPTVKVQQNVADLELDTLAEMIDTVNDAALWGCGSRCVKLSSVSWEKLYYGVCSEYYSRSLEFDIDFKTFDRYILDEGTKVLSGAWERDSASPNFGKYVLKNVGGVAPNETNPTHFIRYTDRNGNIARVILDGHGLPAQSAIITGTGTGSGTVPGESTSSDPYYHHIEYYKESNFLLLAIPTVL